MSKNYKAWSQYEAGKAYKQKIGLYEKNRQNERFYRGDQWSGMDAHDLPKPVFNVIKRVVDFLVSSIASSDLNIRYTDENLPYMTDSRQIALLKEALDALTRNAAFRWEKSKMGSKIFRLLTDAALFGDGMLYCYWDSEQPGAQGFSGDIVTEIIDNTSLFVSDVNRADIQSQDYIILSGRAPVTSLISEALKAGVSSEDASKICADGKSMEASGDLYSSELSGEQEEKTTYIIKFWREDGYVVFEKSCKECVIRRVKTKCKLYPVAYFNWSATKGSFHGTSAVGALIPNQKYINRAYSMAMKHMTDTAFSKVIYDKSKIPEWSNGVGEAIAAVGGGNIADAVSVVGVGEMQDGYMELIESALKETKELMGATESALGNIDARNTSAILALQETSKITLEQVRTSFYQCIEDVANIWADMMCAYYPNLRLLPYSQNGEIFASSVDYDLLRHEALNARVDVAQVSRFSAVSAQNVLDKLLDGGYITPEAYIKRLPAGVISSKDALLYEIQEGREQA